MPVPRLLFVCVHNAGRSQLAAGLAARRGGEVVVRSAGTDPDEAVDAVMLAALAEIGVDRTDQVPTRLTDDHLNDADVVIALKPGLDIPRLPGIRYETWELPEPPEWTVEGLRPLRDHLDRRIGALLDELTSGTPGPTAGSGPSGG